MAKINVRLDVINFQEEMRRVEEELLELADDEIETLAEFATKTLRIVTPVDTGEARSGWYLKKGLDGLFIINDVEHIIHLNNGHSKQAPRYFIEQTLSTVGILTPN
jgi:hypothetical protein